jgi:hypothetical protein
MSLGGTLTIESEQPLTIVEMKPEGQSMKKITITDEWSFSTAGGCGNFGMFDKNPVFALNIVEDCDIQARIKVISEVSHDGSSLISDFEKFSFCVNAMVYRIPSNKFPPTQGSINLSALSNPALTTNNGKYSNSLSAMLSQKVLPHQFLILKNRKDLPKESM